MWGLLLTFLSLNTVYAYDCEGRSTPLKVAECNCQAPNASFLFAKLSESFVLESGEEELRDIVRAPANYSHREKIKASYRGLQFATRRLRLALLDKMKDDFDRMIDGAEVRGGVPDLPVRGEVSVVHSVPGALAITMRNLSTTRMKFLPEKNSGKDR